MHRRRGRGWLLTAVAVVLVFLTTLVVRPGALELDLQTRAAKRAELFALSTRALNNSLRYIHTTWWNLEDYRYESTEVVDSLALGSTRTLNVDILTPAGGFQGENPIRVQAMSLFATCIAIQYNLYDAKRVTVSKNQALQRCIGWTNGLAASYSREHWGDKWQSALWVYYHGYASRLIWDYLSAPTQQLVEEEVANEADRLLAIAPPYYQDAGGAVVTKGDSKAEEDGWNANLLLFAAREFPHQPHARRWEAQGRAYAIAAWATPDQIGTDPRIEGSNLNPDGTVTNHGKPIDPDYMFADAEFVAYTALTAAHTNTLVPPETTNNLRRVWRGLTAETFEASGSAPPSRAIYEQGPNHNPTPGIFYPDGPDWSSQRRFNAALMDVEVFAEGIDPGAANWGVVHLDYVLRQQARHPDGTVFSAGESRYPLDEQFAAALEAVMASRCAHLSP